MNEPPRRSPSPHTRRSRWPWLLLLIPALWLLSWPAIGLLVESLQDRGLVGDSFGAVNALFSGLALGGVVVA